MKLNMYHVTYYCLYPSKYPKIAVDIRTSEFGQKSLNMEFLQCFFLYTIVSYLIYVQLQIMCILPLRLIPLNKVILLEIILYNNIYMCEQDLKLNIYFIFIYVCFPIYNSKLHDIMFNFKSRPFKKIK